MTWLGSAAKAVGSMSISVAILVLVVLTSLGIGAPVDTHPFFYFGLILFGGGAVGLLFAGSRIPALSPWSVPG